MAKRGRKTLYTPETVKTIVDTIRIGGSDVDACARGGITQETFYQWMKKAEFSEQVIRARYDGKLQRIARINKAGATDWRADAWYLERRWPEEYAQQLIIKITPEQAKILNAAGLTPGAAFEAIIQQIAASLEAAKVGVE